MGTTWTRHAMCESAFIGAMDWLGLAQDTGGCWAPVKAMMNLRVSYNAENFLTS
jgi:hypothetical protein